MPRPFPPPPTQPFKRLRVTDGLLVDAQRWKLAHNYHRQRQNFQYQALYQPGIVSGLGVSTISPPTDVPPSFRDWRWVQIQPGIAIDLMGNPIVVAKPVEFRISAKPPEREPVQIYLTISYVDPDDLSQRGQKDTVQESFRIDERVDPPDDSEVELCRILLQGKGLGQSPEMGLQDAQDVFFPGINELDLRDRIQASIRPAASVRVGMMAAPEDVTNPAADLGMHRALISLVQSVPGLYPALQCIEQIETPILNAEELTLSACDLLCWRCQVAPRLTVEGETALREYLEAGGGILVEVPLRGTSLASLAFVRQQVQDALERLGERWLRLEAARQASAVAIREEDEAELTKMQQQLEEELQALDRDLAVKISEISRPFIDMAESLGGTLENLQHLPHEHPLRTQPFLFAALPIVDGQELQIFYGAGIILVIGNLSDCWGIDPELRRSRETIRTAQELGINLLQFAWRRGQLVQLAATPEPPSGLSEETIDRPELPPRKLRQST